MTTDPHQGAETWRRIDLGISLLASFREGGSPPVNAVYRAHLGRIVEAALARPDPMKAIGDSFGEMVDGLTFLSNILLSALMQVTGKTDAEILDLYRAQTAQLIEDGWIPPDDRLRDAESWRSGSSC